MWQDAINFYREAAKGIYENDAVLLSGLARA
jgi:hypothetical protein